MIILNEGPRGMRDSPVDDDSPSHFLPTYRRELIAKKERLQEGE